MVTAKNKKKTLENFKILKVKLVYYLTKLVYLYMDGFHGDISIYMCVIVFACISPSNYPILHPALIYPNPVLTAQLLLSCILNKKTTKQTPCLSENRQHLCLVYFACYDDL